MSASGNARRGLDISLDSTRFECDRLRVVRVSGESAISRPFSVDVEVACLDRGGIDVATVLGEDVAIVFTPSDLGREPWQGVQRLHGMVSQVDDRLSTHKDLRGYRFRIVPRLERLALSSSHEIFLGATVPELIERKLAHVSLAAGQGSGADVVLRLDGAYDAREFVVQYKETDLAFVSRLAEHLGIAFFLVDDGDFDQLVFTDHVAGFETDPVRIPFGPSADGQSVLALEAQHRMVPKTHSIHDYNYRAPHVALLATEEVAVGYAGDVVEYGAHAKTPGDAERLAKVRGEEHAAEELVYVGKSSVPALRPGMRVHVVDHPDVEDLDLLIVEVSHEGSQAQGHGGDDHGSYANTFRAIPGDRMYRPPRRTPRPRIAGLLNGVIDTAMSGSGRHAILDDQGRYWVRLLFDTTDRKGQRSSHPIRMMQNHAGENYGTHFPLKPGIEVLVGFVDGDPDRPIIVGAAANPLTPSPVTADNAGIHRIKSVNGTTIDFT
jgi:type VI secretion system secreted protein VgrG